MGFTFGGGGGGFESSAQAELEAFQRELQELQRLQIQEAGFQQVTKDLTFDEAVQRATPQQQQDLELFDRDIQEIQQKVSELEATGQDPNQGFSFGTSAGAERGFGAGSFTLNSLKNHLAQQESKRNSLVDSLSQVQEFQKTPERLEQEARLKELRDLEQTAFQSQLQLFNQRLEEEQGAFGEQADIRAAQREATQEQSKRRLAALRGELPESAALKQAREQAFKQFKESQARIGNTILGQTLEEATAKGTSGQNALSKFKERFELLKQQEQQQIIAGEAGILQTDIAQAGGIGQQAFAGLPGVGPLAASQPGFAGTLPTGVRGSGINAINAAAQPFQFNQRLQLERDKLNAVRSRSASSGLLGGAGGLVGAGAGALLAAPTGGMSILAGAQLGQIFGQGAGNIGQAFI